MIGWIYPGMTGSGIRILQSGNPFSKIDWSGKSWIFWESLKFRKETSFSLKYLFHYIMAFSPKLKKSCIPFNTISVLNPRNVKKKSELFFKFIKNWFGTRPLALLKILIRYMYKLNEGLKGMFAKNEREYRLTAKNKLFWLLLILSVASLWRKLLKTEEHESFLTIFSTYRRNRCK